MMATSFAEKKQSVVERITEDRGACGEREQPGV